MRALRGVREGAGRGGEGRLTSSTLVPGLGNATIQAPIAETTSAAPGRASHSARKVGGEGTVSVQMGMVAL